MHRFRWAEALCAKLCIYPIAFLNAPWSDTWRLGHFVGVSLVWWVGGGGYENHWAHIYQYIQTKWGWRFPFGKRPKEGQENQPKTNRQGQPEEDTAVVAIGGIIRD